jgi:hypothetical protein
LEIPKGGYLPVFRAREEVVAEVVAAGVERRGIPQLWVAAAIVLAAVVGWFAHSWVSVVAVKGEASWLLAALFERQAAVRLVAPDSSFGLLQGFLGRNLSLNDYLQPGYPGELIESSFASEALRERARSVASRPYTTYGNL